MSDSLRQSHTDKLSSSIKPDSQKSTLEQAGDSLKSTADNVAGSLQPQSEKSTTQKVGDSFSGASNKSKSQQGDSILQQASDTVSSGLQSAGNALGLNNNNNNPTK